MGKTVRKGYHSIKRTPTKTRTKELASALKNRWQQQGYTARIHKDGSGYKVTGVQEGAKKRKIKR